MFSEKERQRRLDAAVELMKKEKLEAIYLIGNSVTATNAFGCYRYFTDNNVAFNHASAVITPDGKLIGISASAMGKHHLTDGTFVKDVFMDKDQIHGVVEILKSCGIEKGRLGIFEEVLPASWATRLKAMMPEIELVDVYKEIFPLRTHKSQEEIDIQVQCGLIGDAGYKAFCEAAKPGITEHELVAAAEYAMQQMGMEQSFMLISSGRFGAVENHMSTLHSPSSIDKTLQAGDCVAMEITPKYHGYWTQVVRTICIGEPNPDVDEFRRVIVGAKKAGLSVLKAGVTIGSVVKKMREFVEAEGYVFGMPCGHIAALDLNEERLTEDNERLITPGMMLIIHPTVLNDKISSGIYWGESYIATEDGYICLNSAPQELYVSEK